MTGLILRKKLLICTVLFGTFSAYSRGQNAPDRLEKELIGADRGIWEAVAGSSSNIGQVSAALALDYIDIDSGIRHSRAEVLTYLQGLTKFSFQYASARAYVLSLTCGYVIAELSYSSVHNGKTTSGRVLTTTVFSKEHGRWMAHLHTEMDVKPQSSR